MNKIKYFIFLLFLMGCEERLELTNPNEQTVPTFWKTEAQALGGIDAVYNALIYDGTYMRMFPSAMDVRGDDLRGDSPWADLELFGRFTIPTWSGPVEWIWHHHYQIVWRANQVLINAEDIEFQNQELKNRILGQAYFLRGLAFFNLANAFQVVPVVTGLPREQADYYSETATEEELWNQIFADFAAAKERLPVSYLEVRGPDQGQVGRATKGAAAGMLGKSLLYRQRWDEAAAQFKELIHGPLNVYSLVPNYRDNFSPLVSNNAESLFEVQFATPDEVGGTDINWAGNPNANWRQVSAQAVTYAMDGRGFSDFLPTQGLYQAYRQERTVDGNLDPRLFATIASYEPEAGRTTAYGTEWWRGEDEIYPRKYTNDGFGYENEYDINSGINYRILRYADILMMYAEALNELGQTSEAYQYIQQVRDRVNLPDLATVKPNMSQEEMRDQISHERYLEFALESQRINDLIRWGWFYDEEKLAGLRQRDPDFATWTPGNEYLPIPQRELDVNPNLSPNPSN